MNVIGTGLYIFTAFCSFRHHIHDELGVTFRIKFLKGDESPENAYEFPSDRFVLIS